ncbi:T9SS type B sorting domain-containing protein [Flagellimonas pacifica]|uniref:Gliding motility-associated C-terminal domain-containing protein n=1 Tax=Flagellimonas pacifica TaxID=1247520 RepID=A0A285MXC2_9FLAO|nr:T9SS type B sorting domain-containing protein [Allomuricauda parva]SNZ01835.1 gliding motility-associated C-terminal domain-containing protein [Allomuricauda parva]
MVRRVLKVLVVVLFCQSAYAQVTSDCGSAVPICNNTPINGGANGFGSDDFNGANSSGCLERSLSGVIESNSGWYRFRTMAAGQLGFNIGHDSSEDWDFALYRASDCNNLGDPVRCNFFDNSENKSFIGVGEDPTGDENSVHYEDWLDVNAGEDYFLLINNFSNVNSGFSIQFTGNVFSTNPTDALDCSIVNNLLGSPIAACEGDAITLDATMIGATSYTWYSDAGSGFQVIAGEVNPTLNVIGSAIYRVLVTTATGSIISDVQVAFNPVPTTGMLIDETLCHVSGMIIDLTTKDTEAIGAQNPNDFLVSYHNSQTDANSGTNPLLKQYPKSSGQEVIYVRTASLSNPNCYDASQSFTIDAIETPELTFSENETVCDGATITIGETIPNPSYTYQWSTGELTPSLVVSQEGAYELTVTHSSGGVNCSASRTVNVSISEVPVISVDVDFRDLSPSNTVTITNEAEGDFEYSLNGGPYQTSSVFNEVPGGTHTISARDAFGCGVVTESFVVVGFPPIFSPNGDVLNESWQIEGLSVLNTPIVTIYDRYGKLIKQLTEFNSGWDGSFNGKPLPSTDYWFKLSYLDNDGNRVNAKHLKNHFSLRR